MRDVIIDYDSIIELYTIPIDNDENQVFNIDLRDRSYEITIATFKNKHSFITITCEDLVLCNLQNLKLFVDFTITSPFTDEAFYLETIGLGIPDFINYESFGRTVDLKYAVLSTNDRARI